MLAWYSFRATVSVKLFVLVEANPRNLARTRRFDSRSWSLFFAAASAVWMNDGVYHEASLRLFSSSWLDSNSFFGDLTLCCLASCYFLTVCSNLLRERLIDNSVGYFGSALACCGILRLGRQNKSVMWEDSEKDDSSKWCLLVLILASISRYTTKNGLHEKLYHI